MKKLKLKLDGLVKEVLTVEQMKKINGGYGGSCGTYCIANHTCTSGGDYTCPYCFFWPGGDPFGDWYCSSSEQGGY